MKLKPRSLTLSIIIMILFVLCLVIGWLWWDTKNLKNTAPEKALEKVNSVKTAKNKYDVIVVGTDPEGVVAAVSAARNGLKVLLVDGRNREILGGLMTLGWLNTLDLNYSPEQSMVPGKLNFLNKGIFQEWYDKIEGTSFDTRTAANAFYELVRNEPNIDLLLKVKEIKPLIKNTAKGIEVAGVHILTNENSNQTIASASVIDATQDADIAAATGAPFTWGREDIGDPKSQMAVTLVFKLSGITQEVWDSFGKHKNTGIDKMSVWGFPEMKEYPSTNKERVRMRGLNIGRQNDNTILINAMQIFGVNPLDPQSVQEGIDIGKKEAPHVVEYMKKNFPEFKDVTLADTAPELYVRETRHLKGEYRLTMSDLMENRDHWDAIAYGSYEVDIQSINHTDPGAVMMKPKQYGVPFRSLVPQQVDGILVVGRSASFDSLPHGSARVIPLGMATAQAAGAAAKITLEKNITFRELSQSKTDIENLRNRLISQGMELQMSKFETPSYIKHKAFSGLKAAIRMFVTIGGYDNKSWELDSKSNAQRFVYNMSNVRKVHPSVFKGDPSASIKDMTSPNSQKLSLSQAAFTIGTAIGLNITRERALSELQTHSWIKEETLKQIEDTDSLSNGEAFLLINDVIKYYVGVNYD
ncbi:FAD-dependent oxidoreductase [Paenibacillus tyrfis]|uniref:FAD-dependent oxidoreductase n=1 Tax=Paenibacillus tyrfis TaxID=1501230 RepID=UPI0021664571|nr:FAD-dependent oxidoreductase [Paenibacillus tyrfis]